MAGLRRATQREIAAGRLTMAEAAPRLAAYQQVMEL
jgi:hypothetical protein